MIHLFSKNKFNILLAPRHWSSGCSTIQTFMNIVCEGNPVPLVSSTGYSVQCVVRWLMVYLYNRSHISHSYRMIFLLVSPSASYWYFFKVIFCCFVLCDMVPVVLLLAVIVWLNSEFFSSCGCWCLWGSLVYMALYVVLGYSVGCDACGVCVSSVQRGRYNKRKYSHLNNISITYYITHLVLQMDLIKIFVADGGFAMECRMWGGSR